MKYSKNILKEFKNPKNVGRIKNPDGFGKVTSKICGDLMYIYIKIGKNKKGEKIIKNIKAETLGCIAAVSSASILTKLVKGKTLKYAKTITKDKIIKKLGKLPRYKIHCSVLAADALKNAIKDYEKRR